MVYLVGSCGVRLTRRAMANSLDENVIEAASDDANSGLDAANSVFVPLFRGLSPGRLRRAAAARAPGVRADPRPARQGRSVVSLTAGHGGDDARSCGRYAGGLRR